MNRLPNEVVVHILTYLDLKDRTTVRLVSKRMKDLSDYIKIEKLIIFHRLPQVSGKLKYTNEPYSLIDSVYVTDLDAFLDLFSDNLKNIQTLVIHSVKHAKHNLRFSPNELRHLELYDIEFATAKLLESPKLKNVHLFQSTFCKLSNLNVNKLSNLTVPNSLFLRIKSQLKSIEHLDLYEELNRKSEQELSATTDLNIGHLKIAPADFRSLIEIYNCNKKIKRIDCFFRSPTNTYVFDLKAQEPLYNEFLKIKDKQTDLFIYGINPVEASFEYIIRFYATFRYIIHYNYPYLTLTPDDGALKLIKRDFNQDHLEEVYKLIACVSIICLPVDDFIFKKLINAQEIIFTLDLIDSKRLETILNYWPNLNGLKVYQIEKCTLDDYALKLDFLNRFESLQKIKIAFFELIDLNFLLKLKNINILILLLYKNRVQNDFILNVFRDLKHLCYLNVLFMRPSKGCSKEELRKFHILFCTCILCRFLIASSTLQPLN